MSTSPITDNAQAAAFDLNRMRHDVARALHEDPADLADDDNLMELGLDSIRAMALATRWREAGVPMEFADMAVQPTLAHWWELAQRALVNSLHNGKPASCA